MGFVISHDFLGPLGTGIDIQGTVMTVSGIEHVSEDQINDALDKAGVKAASITELIISEPLNTILIGAFEKFFGMEKLTLPNTLKKIGPNSFLSCTSLKTVEIPDSVESIDSSAFASSTSLESVSFGSNPKLTIISSYCFENTSITSIIIPETITSIEDHAFSNSKLITVKIPKNVEYLGMMCITTKTLKRIEVDPENKNWKTDSQGLLYSSDGALLIVPAAITDKIVLPEMCTRIMMESFDHCISSHVMIPRSVTIIDMFAFVYSEVQEITYDANIERLDYCVFTECYNLTTFTFKPNNPLKIIDINCFQNCRSLVNLNLEELVNLEEFGSYAFESVSSLKSITFPPNVKYIPQGITNHAKSMKTVRILSDLLELSDEAFSYMPSLEVFQYHGKKAFTSNYIFISCPKLKKVQVSKNYPADNFGGLPVEKVLGDIEINSLEAKEDKASNIKYYLIGVCSCMFLAVVVVIAILIRKNHKSKDEQEAISQIPMLQNEQD